MRGNLYAQIWPVGKLTKTDEYRRYPIGTVPTGHQARIYPGPGLSNLQKKLDLDLLL